MSLAENATMSLTSPFKERFNLIASCARNGRQSEVWERTTLEERNRKKEDDLGEYRDSSCRFGSLLTTPERFIPFFFVYSTPLHLVCFDTALCMKTKYFRRHVLTVCTVHRPIYLPCFLITIHRHYYIWKINKIK